MAFMIAHPDYMAFDQSPSSSEYAVSLYQDFLDYVQKNYWSSAWFARPRDIEEYLRQAMPPDKIGERSVA
jgi:hypothetical protein